MVQQIKSKNGVIQQYFETYIAVTTTFMYEVSTPYGKGNLSWEHDRNDGSNWDLGEK